MLIIKLPPTVGCSSIDKKIFDQEFESKCINIPNLNLLIRTRGDQRAGNFLLWKWYLICILFHKPVISGLWRKIT
ncbi:hypothetical protein MTR67_035017 [Solanum verrucosum]|uniref:Uncharacterized protein n=1 Tax=Solanum verrucosum TaxID=315347 RepID=A0AAF0U951_SOLVR|nr:hypothetical protein MTR67_035017 [Solanum verrucosum]